MGKTDIVLLLAFSCIIASALGSLQIRGCIARQCGDAPPNCYYNTDADGCPTCNLICNPSECGPHICPQKCYNGYVKDQNGCNTCSCLPGCYKKQCPRECPHGSYLDKAGCPTCNCKPKPLDCHQFMTCPLGVCPAKCACQPNCYLNPVPKEITEARNNELSKQFWQYFFQP